jgi:hypothetical protein
MIPSAGTLPPASPKGFGTLPSSTTLLVEFFSGTIIPLPAATSGTPHFLLNTSERHTQIVTPGSNLAQKGYFAARKMSVVDTLLPLSLLKDV